VEKTKGNFRDPHRQQRFIMTSRTKLVWVPACDDGIWHLLQNLPSPRFIPRLKLHLPSSIKAITGYTLCNSKASNFSISYILNHPHHIPRCLAWSHPRLLESSRSCSASLSPVISSILDGESFSLIQYAGAPTHMIEVIGEPNRSASIRMSNYNGNSKSSEKKGDVPQYDLLYPLSL
jgi:hypothetical protein